MKYQYARIDLIDLLFQPEVRRWLDLQPDVEYREDYQCYFVRTDTEAYTWLALKHGALIAN